MPKNKESFWVALMEYCQDHEELVWLWNGYIGWKFAEHLREEEPRYSWPRLANKEKALLDQIAANCAGHPSWNKEPYMDFSGSQFDFEIDFSDLILVAADFRRTTFNFGVQFDRTHFFMQSNFRRAEFFGTANFNDTIFQTNVNFNRAVFERMTFFRNVQFNGGASFFKSRFYSSVRFNGSIFREKFYSGSTKPIHLARFEGVEFRGRAYFNRVVFGEDPNQMDKGGQRIRVADFNDAKFSAKSSFRRAEFKGAPTFFNCTLHEDTDLSRVKWPEAMPTGTQQIDDAIRAWERLELMMSKLEKPLDRQIFYRLKMRTRQLTDGRFLRVLNRSFEVTCEYGWSVSRAACWWIGHWLIAALLLFLNVGRAVSGNDVLKALELFAAALGTAFANSHAFLGLAAESYLESCGKLIEDCDQLRLIATVEAMQAVLGPVFLFLLLLTLRNRFRLA